MDTLFSDRISDVPRSFIREILKVALDLSVISFAGGLPNRDFFPVKGLNEATEKVFATRGTDIFQYSNSEGIGELREYIAQRYKAKLGLEVPVESILITSGSQQGLDLLGKTVLNRGDRLVIEEPGYLGAIQAFSIYRPAFLPVPVSENGMDVRKLREAGSRHVRCLTELLPPHLYEGISELEICHKISELFYSQGHLGILRMESYGEEIFLGHISVGESANYPSVFNGPVGLKGVHPAAPYMGSADVKWSRGKPLTIDNGFTLDGYMTDKTQVYWLGNKKDIPADALRAHDFCIDLQGKITEMLKPGTLPSEIWEYCLAEVERSGWTEGFMGHGKNKVSFVGHGIGLAIDEYPVLTKGFDLPLEEGMTLAVEPKIGIPGFGMVGVENTFEVTPGGGKCLTGEDFDISVMAA